MPSTQFDVGVVGFVDFYDIENQEDLRNPDVFKRFNRFGEEEEEILNIDSVSNDLVGSKDNRQVLNINEDYSTLMDDYWDEYLKDFFDDDDWLV